MHCLRMGNRISQEEHASDIFNRILEGELANVKDLEGKLGNNCEYENLVFEGGGAKGIAYCGAVRALEELGMMKKFKRFAGTSVGAITAMMLAVGGSSVDGLAEGLNDFQHLLEDSNRLALPFNLVKNFGWHHGDRMLKHLYDRVEQLSGERNLTFEGLYKKRGIELCIVVTNLSCCAAEYFHTKTTPDMAIALAVRMSISIPVLFQPPVRFDDVRKGRQVYVDGGLCNNYPVSVFDGWYLSMEKEDSFFHKIGSKEPRFGKRNDKTLGLLVFDAYESETDQDVYLKRYNNKMPVRPNSVLAVKNAEKVNQKMEKMMRKYTMMDAAKNFLKLLGDCDLDRSGTISPSEFNEAMRKVKEGEMGSEEWKLLFGVKVTDMSPEQLFHEIDTDMDNEISFSEFLAFMTKKGVPLREMMADGIPRMDIRSIGGFFESLLETNMVVLKKLIAKPDDVERTIGIYTDYVGTTDFGLTMDDKEYLVKHGWLSALSFLRERVEQSKEMEPEDKS